MGEAFWTKNGTKGLILNPEFYGSGSKMAEHYWKGNPFLYELLILLKEEWKGDIIFHESDYEITSEDYIERYPHDYQWYEGLTFQHYTVTEDGMRWLMEDDVPKMWKEWNKLNQDYYLVNYDKEQYSELGKCPSNTEEHSDFSGIPYLLNGRWKFNRLGLERKNSSIIIDYNEIVTIETKYPDHTRVSFSVNEH